MNITSRVAFFLLLILSVFVTAAGTISRDADDHRHVEYGRDFPYVAKIICRNSKTGSVEQASCVLVSPTHAITAAHVVEDSDEWTVITDDGKEHRIGGVSINSGHAIDKIDAADIAICWSRSDFGVGWYPPLYAGEDEAGKMAVIAGWGRGGTFGEGRTKPSGEVRRAGTNVICEVRNGFLVCTAGGGDQTGMELLIAPGDSGGGLFIDGRLAGVNSHVEHRENKAGDFKESSGHTRISQHREWIEREMKCGRDK